MLLQPRKFKYKTRQKKRSIKFPTSPSLRYGRCGVILQSPLRITAKRVFRLKLFLKRSSRKADITKRSFWVFVFPHLPLSRKPKGMRMGKGVGKLSTWYTEIGAGNALIEFKNLRIGRAEHFQKQVAHKLSPETTLFLGKTRLLKIVGCRNLSPRLEEFF